MAETMYKITINNQEKQYPPKTRLLDIAKEYQTDYSDDIVLALLNNRLRELNKAIDQDGELVFITTADQAGRKAYRRSVTLLMQKAVYNLTKDMKTPASVKVMHSISQGFYCELVGGLELSPDFILKLKAEMMDLANAALPIRKQSIGTDAAVELFRTLGMTDKERLFRYRRSSRVNIYSIAHYTDYYYGYMVPDTGYLKYFNIERYANGFVLMFPYRNTKAAADFEPSHKLFQVLEEAAKWGEKVGIRNVGELNDAIAKGMIRDVILVQEALMERRIGTIAETIVDTKDKKFVMIAGPSSSGKTTFSHRLSIQLMAQGLKPHPIALDNYYKNREDTPRDEFGEFDFECLEALDVEQFNKDMAALLAGEKVKLPTFDFQMGRREYKGDFKQLKEHDILVIEGIHGLNDKLSYALPKSSKLKIYISALTQLNIDEHNSLPTTDGRLIRRMVRDARTRGTTAKVTIAMWDSVRRGEERHIFPFQEQADIMFNSALIYELAILKQYAEPLLFGIDKKAPEYMEAKRLLKFLDYFLPVPSEDVGKNSILREFIGGSCFRV
ncbi:nucleoside kinase [Lachnospiraceae bacterium ZAX-1]